MSEDAMTKIRELSRPALGERRHCAVGRATASLSGDDVSSLAAALQALDDPLTTRISCAGVGAWLTSVAGIDVSWQAVRTHKQGACSCARR